MGCKKITLNKKIIIYFVSIIFLVVSTIALTINIVFQKEFASYVEENNINEMDKLVKRISLEHTEKGWNKKNIEQLGQDAIFKGFVTQVYDSNGTMIWSALEYDQNSCSMMMGNIENNMQHIAPNWTGEYKTEEFIIKDKESNILGYVNIGHYGPFYYLDEDISFLKDMNNIIVTIGVVTIIITIIIALIVSNNIAKPIKIVSKRTKEMSKGGYNQRLDYASNVKELHELIYCINELAQNLQEQENLRKQLTMDVAHELRTPLTSVQTHLEAIIDGVWEPSKERLSSIQEEVIRLSNLVNELKKLSEFDCEKNKLNLSEVHIDKVIKNIVYNNESKALEKNIKIEVDLEPVIAKVDKEKIAQLVVNILSNSIRYTGYNGFIKIKLYEENENIKIHFKDNGMGISKEDLKNIFERFYRVDSSRTRKTGGIGVGLTISKHIVEMHSGTIEVHSKVNEGSEFIISFPKNM